MYHRLFGSVCASILLLANGVANADLLDRFRAEYPEAASKLDSAYSNSKAVGTQTRTDISGNPLWKIAVECDRRDDAVRELRTYLESESKNATAGTVDACGGTASKFFEIYRMDGDSQYTVKWFGKRDNFRPFSQFRVMPLFASYCIEDMRISDALANPKWTFKSADMDSLDGQSVARVDFTTMAGPGQKDILDGSVYCLLPSWAIAGWRTTLRKPVIAVERTDQNLTMEGRISYSDMTPVPTVSRIHIWRSRPTKHVDEIDYQMSHVAFTPLDSDAFTLKPFNVAEPAHAITPGQVETIQK